MAIVVPGLMGTRLAVDGAHIWVNLASLALGGMNKLKYENGARGVAPDGVFDTYYRRLVESLSATHDVRPFPYDWRQSIEATAGALRDAVEAALADAPQEQPVRIVAHSMGGLVSRAMIARHPNTWDECCSRAGARFVMFGTSTRGSHAVVRLLMGRERLLRMLALVDLKHRMHEILDILVRFPGLLELLPEEQDATTSLIPRFGISWLRFPTTPGPSRRPSIYGEPATCARGSENWTQIFLTPSVCSTWPEARWKRPRLLRFAGEGSFSRPHPPGTVP